MTYAQERIADVWDEAWLLMQAHAREAAIHEIPFQPGRSVYERMEKAGATRLFTARSAGVLIGYAVFVLSFHPHYVGEKVATQDVVYVEQSHRGFGAAKFLAWAEGQLKAEGAGAVIWSVRVGSVDFGRTLKRMGYEPSHTAYFKRL